MRQAEIERRNNLTEKITRLNNELNQLEKKYPLISKLSSDNSLNSDDKHIYQVILALRTNIQIEKDLLYGSGNGVRGWSY